MPKIIHPLTAIEVKNLKKDGVHALGGVQGLCLRIRGAHRAYILRYSFDDKRREITLGSYATITLKVARDKASEYRAMIENGQDPIEIQQQNVLMRQQERKARELSELTFKKTVESYEQYQDQLQAWTSEKEKALFLGRLGNHILPVIGNMTLNEIRPKEIADVLRPHWTAHPALAKKLRQITRQIFSWAKAQELLIGDNPVDNQVLQHLLPRSKKELRHHAMLEIKDVPRFMKRLHECPSISAKCLEFAILTATRSANARFAQWSEIDLDKGLWVIPAQKMKVKTHEHLVPLSKQAIDLLRKLHEHIISDYVFASPVGNSFLSDGSLKTVIKRLHMEALTRGEKGFVDPKMTNRRGDPAVATPHGIARASFRTWAQDDELGNDERYSDRVAELCLHHMTKDTYKGAYNRAEMMKSRAEMMQAWADFCFKGGTHE